MVVDFESIATHIITTFICTLTLTIVAKAIFASLLLFAHKIHHSNQQPNVGCLQTHSCFRMFFLFLRVAAVLNRLAIRPSLCVCVCECEVHSFTKIYISFFSLHLEFFFFFLTHFWTHRVPQTEGHVLVATHQGSLLHVTKYFGL